MVKYGFSREFLKSGDLRVNLALIHNAPGKAEAFANSLQYDDLIMTTGPSKNVLAYNDEAVAKQTAYHNAHDSKNGALASLNLLHRGSTCMVVGCGPSLRKDKIKDLQDKGVIIITLGNACVEYQEADIWIGSRDTPHYQNHGLENPRTMAFYPVDYAVSSRLWDMEKQDFSAYYVRSMPNKVNYRLSGTSSVSEYFAKPDVSNLGCPNTITTAMTIIGALGFTNIILNGIDLGGTLDEFYSFPEIPHKNTYERKLEEYADVQSVLEELFKGWFERAVRVYATEPGPFQIPILPEEYIVECITNMKLSRRSSFTKGIGMDVEPKVQQVKKMARDRNAALTGEVLADKFQDLIDLAPHHFNTVDMQEVHKKLKEEMAKPQGCVGCAKKKIIAPLYQKFANLVSQKDPDIQEIWKTTFPDNYTLIHKGDLVFRDDKQ
jgi:hypothetical protein